MNDIFGNNILVGRRSLDYLWTKMAASLENIANVDTPGYKAKYVTFEDTYRSALRTASGNRDAVRGAAKGAVWQVKRSETESARLDGNNVLEDTEQTELTRTAIQYQYMLSSINSDIARLSSVIKG
ncbi:MAG: flagellar basal body rod protein FlgB [Ruminococcus sp.]|nr:flagellar basal body rod protein FlgB [Ruminococcus sp.]